jgi:predicted NBD/HSP70 family sugar kinase
VDPLLGTVRFAVNVGIGDEGLDLGARLIDELAVNVHIENDVRAAALGADWYLANESGPVNDLAYLSIGTGIAAGFVERGRLRRGNGLVAGEIGHIPIDPQGPVCVCGQIGCIEAIASGSAIDRLWPTEEGPSAAALQAAATNGDGAARRLWAGVIGGLSRAVLLLALTWDPEVIVLSGGVASLGDVLRDAIAERLAQDAHHSEFLGSLDLRTRMRVIDPSVALGPIGAVRAAHAARPVLLP